MLLILSNVLRKDLLRLYRDDGLAIVSNLSSPEIERKREAIIKLFKECCLKITIQTNLEIVNFHDVEKKSDKSHVDHIENQIICQYKPTKNQITPYYN